VPRASWDFEVEAVPVYIQRDVEFPSYHPVPNHKAIRRVGDPTTVFYIGSDKYQPISHRKCISALVGKAEEGGLIQNIHVFKNGARLFADFLSPDKHAVRVGDEVRVGVRVINSLDGSHRLSVVGLIHRLACTNGMVSASILERWSKKHLTGAFDPETFATTVVEAIAEVAGVIPRLKRMTEIPVVLERFEEMMVWMGMAERYRKVAREVWAVPEITTLEDRGNLWHVWNIFTYLATHELPRHMGEDGIYEFMGAVDQAIEHFYGEVLAPPA